MDINCCFNTYNCFFSEEQFYRRCCAVDDAATIGGLVLIPSLPFLSFSLAAISLLSSVHALELSLPISGIKKANDAASCEIGTQLPKRITEVVC